MFKYSLDKIIKIAKKKDKIYLPPANDFGYQITEQQVAYNYLKSKTCAKIIYFKLKKKKYIDTYKNFFELKKFLIYKKKWPINCIVVTYYLTKRRVIFSLKKNNYQNFKILEIKKKFNIKLNAPIVFRLLIYKINFLHLIYEITCNIFYKIKYSNFIFLNK